MKSVIVLKKPFSLHKGVLVQSKAKEKELIVLVTKAESNDAYFEGVVLHSKGGGCDGNHCDAFSCNAFELFTGTLELSN